MLEDWFGFTSKSAICFLSAIEFFVFVWKVTNFKKEKMYELGFWLWSETIEGKVKEIDKIKNRFKINNFTYFNLYKY